MYRKMGNEYNHHHHHHHHHHQIYQKSIFLPIVCRFSIKDIIKPNNHNNKDPSSPKVSCMAQVVKRNNNNDYRKYYSKLKKLLFSSRTLVPPAVNNCVMISGGSRRSSSRDNDRKSHVSDSSRRLKFMKNDVDKCAHSHCCCVSKLVNAGELDPPLPVVKRMDVSEVNNTLWSRRRLNGVALKSLKIGHNCIHLPNDKSM